MFLPDVHIYAVIDSKSSKPGLIIPVYVRSLAARPASVHFLPPLRAKGGVGFTDFAISPDGKRVLWGSEYYTVAAASPRPRAMHLPTPLVAPVTTATLPSSVFICSIPFNFFDGILIHDSNDGSERCSAIFRGRQDVGLERYFPGICRIADQGMGMSSDSAGARV